MTNEKVVEIKSCKQCNSKFEITDKDLEFYDKISPKFAGEKFSIPTPTLCPECRIKRRFSFRNERKLYKGTCKATGKNIISMFSPDKNFVVYNTDYRWSDNWNGMDYGLDFDFNKTFFEQFNDLQKVVPVSAILNTNTENSEYSNYILGAKNCYMSFVVYYDSENVFYSYMAYASSNIIDCYNVLNCNKCFNSTDLTKCYNCRNCSNLEGCDDCYFSRNMRGCSFCIGCANLINKKYCILNKECTKEEYEKELKNINNIERQKNYNDFIKKEPYLYTNSINSENCIGDYLKDCKNLQYSFDVSNSEDSKFILSEETKNSYDGIGGTLEYCYEFTRTGWSQRVMFSNDIVESNNIYYSMSMYYCKNCFGCIGLKNKEYCVFNKQYTKEEYEKLVAKIITHMKKTNEWGEFFSSSLSQFGYNETIAYEYYPMKKDDAIKLGFNWCDYEQELPKVEKIIPASKLPDSINNIPDDILNWAIMPDENVGNADLHSLLPQKPFRIIKQELEFYRKYNLPIPKMHPDERHMQRLLSRNPRIIFDRKCSKCEKNLKSTFSNYREEIIYCQECYDKYVY